MRRDHDPRPGGAGVLHALVDVQHRQGDVDDTVAVPPVMVGQRLAGETAPLMTNRASPDRNT